MRPLPDVESFRALFGIFERRKSFVFATVASVLLVSASVFSLATPAYAAGSVIQFDSPFLSAAQGDSSTVTPATLSLTRYDFPAPFNLAMGAGFGVFFGCCVALLLDAGKTRKKEEGWTLRINGSSIPPIRGMNSAAFHQSARVSQPGWNGFTLIQRTQPTVGRAVTQSGPGRVRQMGNLILLRPAAGGRPEMLR